MICALTLDLVRCCRFTNEQLTKAGVLGYTVYSLLSRTRTQRERVTPSFSLLLIRSTVLTYARFEDLKPNPYCVTSVLLEYLQGNPGLPLPSMCHNIGDSLDDAEKAQSTLGRRPCWYAVHRRIGSAGAQNGAIHTHTHTNGTEQGDVAACGSTINPVAVRQPLTEFQLNGRRMGIPIHPDGGWLARLSGR
jgi:hypothetical protein